MRDRLTLKSTHPPAQAPAPAERPARAPGQRQSQALQTAFLDGILNQRVTGYRVNGIKLIGQVRQHDQFTLQLQNVDGIDSLIFKHAISTIIPGAPVTTWERRTPFGKRPEWPGDSRRLCPVDEDSPGSGAVAQRQAHYRTRVHRC